MKLKKFLSILFLRIALFGCTMMGHASAEIRIGLATSLSGSFTILGEQMVKGARIAAATEPKGEKIVLIIVDDKCTPAGGSSAAEMFIKAKVQIVTGFLCTEALESALPFLAEKNIPVISTGTRDLTLTEKRTKTPFPIFRLIASSAQETEAISNILSKLWRDKSFAIIDDGTIYGRNLAQNVRVALEDKGMKPVFTNTYRPDLNDQSALVARLRRADVQYLFIGGERNDAALIARSAAAVHFPLVIAGSDSLNATQGKIDLAAGTLMIAVPNTLILPSTTSAPDTDLSHGKIQGKIQEGYVVPSYSAIQIAIQTVTTSEEEKQTLPTILHNTHFKTALGTIHFNEKGIRTDNPYQLLRYNGKEFILEEEE